jgi:hypothetical protein
MSLTLSDEILGFSVDIVDRYTSAGINMYVDCYGSTLELLNRPTLQIGKNSEDTGEHPGHFVYL